MHPASERRFWAKVDRNGDCWIWRGARISTGYGNFTWSLNGERHWRLAHRVIIELTTGEAIPPRMEVDHLCRVRECVNPAHLEVVTQQVNALRAIPYRKEMTRSDTCRSGHPWQPGHFSVDRQGWRKCLVCRREQESQQEFRDARNARRRARRAEGRPIKAA